MDGEEGGEVCVCVGGHGHGNHCAAAGHRHPTLHGLPAAQPVSTGWSVWGLVCGGEMRWGRGRCMCVCVYVGWW